jgi:hypothetical protein
MATVLEGCTTEAHLSVVRFLWAKGHNAKDIHKEMFPVYDGKCLRRKAVHSWVANVSLVTKWWLRQPSKDFYAAGFDALIKRWDKCNSVGGGYVEE